MIPVELRKIPNWVCVKNGSKVPMKAFEYEPASSSDPTTWSGYTAAQEAVDAGVYDQVGFVFSNNGIVGIDIDAGFDEEGFMTPLAIDIVGACRSYTEVSRSGRGFHILVKGILPFDGKNNQNGVEIYQNKRYFIMTGHDCIFEPEIIENQKAIEYIVATYFPQTERESSREGTGSRIYNPQWELPQEGRVRLRPVYPRITPGSRNICMTSLAGMLHSIGYTKRQIFDELLYANTTACDPSLSRLELKQIVNSVTRYKR